MIPNFPVLENVGMPVGKKLPSTWADVQDSSEVEEFSDAENTGDDDKHLYVQDSSEVEEFSE
eukprot:7009347-Prorocentrum_lima.AAC.1